MTRGQRIAAPAVLGAALVMAALSASADEFQAGLVAYNTGAYRQALGYWRPLAKRGDAKAQSGLAYLYYKGLGVPRRPALAAAWFRKAADQGAPTAQLFLGLMHYAGDGVPRSAVLAYKWCDLALAAGVVEALQWRDHIALTMTPLEVERARRRVAEWYATAPGGN